MYRCNDGLQNTISLVLELLIISLLTSVHITTHLQDQRESVEGCATRDHRTLILQIGFKFRI